MSRHSYTPLGEWRLCGDLEDGFTRLVGQGKPRQAVQMAALILLQVSLIGLAAAGADSGASVVAVFPSSRHLEICSWTNFFWVQSYNALLIVLCTSYGYMTRHVRRSLQLFILSTIYYLLCICSDFNETRYISFAMFAMVLIWGTGFFIIIVIL